ncbi:hypothetical protein NC652_026512 [Populus alba x Populus x berolinensis]|nr:hypothetical protein NC652_026512 [Populus alba x Populus x berolinensis]
MRKFDPWPVFFRREWNRNWPFLVGFSITGTLITKFSLSLTEEDAKNSPFVQRHKSLKWVLLIQRTGALSSSITSYELTQMTLYMRKEDEKLSGSFRNSLVPALIPEKQTWNQPSLLIMLTTPSQSLYGMECLVNQKSKRKGKGGRKHIRGLNLQFKQNSIITIMEKKMKGKGNHRSYHSQEIRGH